MPTRYKRVSVTLTPPLADARERLRRRGLEPTVGQLALAGANALLGQAQASQAEEQQRARLRKRLADRLRSGAIDADALREVRSSGWSRA